MKAEGSKRGGGGGGRSGERRGERGRYTDVGAGQRLRAERMEWERQVKMARSKEERLMPICDDRIQCHLDD